MRLDPNSTLARNNLARARLLAGDRAQALVEWRASLAIDPTQEEIRRSIAALGERP